MADCRHHYVIDPPAGPSSWGACKHCGNRRAFSNIAGEEGNFGAGTSSLASKSAKGVAASQASKRRRFKQSAIHLTPAAYDYGVGHVN